jgi:hypothetical protein
LLCSVWNRTELKLDFLRSEILKCGNNGMWCILMNRSLSTEQSRMSSLHPKNNLGSFRINRSSFKTRWRDNAKSVVTTLTPTPSTQTRQKRLFRQVYTFDVHD